MPIYCLIFPCTLEGGGNYIVFLVTDLLFSVFFFFF